MRISSPAKARVGIYKAHLTLGSTGLDQDNVSVFHDVVLALGHDLTGGLDGSLVSILSKGSIVEDDALNESLLEICSGNVSD